MVHVLTVSPLFICIAWFYLERNKCFNQIIFLRGCYKMIWVEMKMYGFLFQKGHLLASQEGKILLPALPSALLSCSLSESPSLLSCVRTVPPILCAGPPGPPGQYGERRPLQAFPREPSAGQEDSRCTGLTTTHRLSFPGWITETLSAGSRGNCL